MYYRPSNGSYFDTNITDNNDNNKKTHLTQKRAGEFSLLYMVEVAGIEPASEEASTTASTSVA